MTTTSTNVFPVGAVVALAGPLSGGGTPKQGWLLCDGTLVALSSFGELDAVIGSYWGASGTSFALPDLQGRFLRGVDQGTGRDPDAGSRTQPRGGTNGLSEGGNVAPHVGTMQGGTWVTHTHGLTQHNDHHDTIAQELIGSDTYDCANDTSETRSSGSAGCTETRPVNQYVAWAIKAQSNSPEVIVGTVIAYAGALSSNSQLAGAGWLRCDGTALDRNGYSALYSQLQTSYGNVYASDFCLPCYFGRFLRGAGSSAIDHEMSLRTAPRPELSQGGATGGNLGSVQADGFPCHYHTYPGHHTEHELSRSTNHDMCTVSNAAYATVQTGSAGTAPDTRPKNLALDYLIAWTNADQKATASTPAVTFAVPPGAVVAFAGDLDASPDITGWLPCDGRSLSTSTYGPLFGAIAYAHGGAGDAFNVPDLRGRFVRAVDPSGTVDPGPRSAAAGGGNGAGVGSYQADGLRNHTHSMTTHSGSYSVKKDFISTTMKTDTISATSSAPLVSAFDNVTPTDPFGSENRPANAYVYYLIKT